MVVTGFFVLCIILEQICLAMLLVFNAHSLIMVKISVICEIALGQTMSTGIVVIGSDLQTECPFKLWPECLIW